MARCWNQQLLKFLVYSSFKIFDTEWDFLNCTFYEFIELCGILYIYEIQKRHDSYGEGIPNSLLILKDPFGAKHRHAMWPYYIVPKLLPIACLFKTWEKKFPFISPEKMQFGNVTCACVFVNHTVIIQFFLQKQITRQGKFIRFSGIKSNSFYNSQFL